MIKVFKLIDNQWEEIDNILQGLTFTEVLDDTLDTGLVQYDSYSDELMPVFTPIKVEHYHSPNDYKKIASSNLTITKQNNGLFQCSAGEYYNVLGSVNLGDIIYLDKQTNQVDKGVYKVHSAQGLNVYLENIDEFFLSAEERITVVTKANPITYRHQLIVVEPTKYLEKIIVNNLCLTNKNDTLKQQLDKTLINCMLLEASESPIFSVSSELNAFLEQTPGEDFFFDGGSTLREVLDEMLSVVNARVYIEKITDFDNIDIKYVDMNEVKKTIEFEKMVSIERSNNVEMYHGSIVLAGSNAKIKTPLRQGWTAFKTVEPVLTINNAIIFSDFPIETITYFEVMCDAIVKTGPVNNEITNNIKKVIITDYVFDEEAYNTLKDSRGNTEPVEMATKANSIYYTRGEKGLKLLYRDKFLGFKIANIQEAIITKLKWEHGQDARVTFGRDKLNFLISFVYYPFVEIYGTITKPFNNNATKARIALIDNQNEKIIDANRYGDNLYGKSIRLGNDDYAVDDLVSNITEIKNIGERTADNYIIYKKEISYFNEHAKVRYTLSKNYNNLNEKIGINREKRIYDIPLNGFENELILKEYVLVTCLPEIVHPVPSGKLSTYGISLMLGGKVQDSINNYILFETNTNEGTKGPFELNVATYVLGNAFHFTGKTFDNYSVGPSISGKVIGGKKTIYNPYVDEARGEFDSFKIRMLRYKNPNHEEDIAKAKLLPKTAYSYYGYGLIGEHEYQYKKDAFQQINFNYQLEVRPVNDLVRAIIIGKEFFNSNGLTDFGIQTFKNISGQISVKIYASTEEYSILENRKAKGIIQTGMGISIGNNSIQITGNPTLSNFKSLAIADNLGNLYLATNLTQETFRTFYFIPSKTMQ